MHWMVWFSHCTVCFPSTFPSQSAVDAVCIPAPAFCTKLHVTTYLNGLLRPAKRFRHPSCERRRAEGVSAGSRRLRGGGEGSRARS